jgi:hypothetical protein
MVHTNERIIKNKIGLINLAEELQSISKACKVMGLSRETFSFVRDYNGRLPFVRLTKWVKQEATE